MSLSGLKRIKTRHMLLHLRNRLSSANRFRLEHEATTEWWRATAENELAWLKETKYLSDYVIDTLDDAHLVVRVRPSEDSDWVTMRMDVTVSDKQPLRISVPDQGERTLDELLPIVLDDDTPITKYELREIQWEDMSHDNSDLVVHLSIRCTGSRSKSDSSDSAAATSPIKPPQATAGAVQS